MCGCIGCERMRVYNASLLFERVEQPGSMSEDITLSHAASRWYRMLVRFSVFPGTLRFDLCLFYRLGGFTISPERWWHCSLRSSQSSTSRTSSHTDPTDVSSLLHYDHGAPCECALVCTP
jgi:hypothetical protein